MGLDAALRVVLGDLELDVDLAVAPGEVVAVLGPNGAGKTTLLHALAGLVPLAAGSVALDGRILDEPAAGTFVPPERRPVGVAFQDALLFPHLSALDNVAFGLRCRGVGRSGARARAGAWLDRMGLGAEAGSRPAALSGGQARRVALARALAPEPRLLLLDEPLSALDADAAARVRADLRRLLRAGDGVRLLVTHDPVEAMLLADRLVVLEAGRVVQEGDAVELSRRPRTPYVARLVGLNLFRGRARGGVVALPSGGRLVTATPGPDGDAFAVVPPEAVALFGEEPHGSPRNVWPATVRAVEVEADRATVAVEGPVPLVAVLTPAAVVDLGLREDAPVWAAVKATDVRVYPVEN